MNVTNVVVDTLTIQRAQGDTTAKSIGIGWRISNAIFASDLDLTEFVTYTGATNNVDLGTHSLTTDGHIRADNYYGSNNYPYSIETYFGSDGNVPGQRVVIQSAPGDGDTQGGDVVVSPGTDGGAGPGKVVLGDDSKGLVIDPYSLTDKRNLILPDTDVDLTQVADIPLKANTSDLGTAAFEDVEDLPVSTATQTALNAKANASDTVNLTGDQTIAGVS